MNHASAELLPLSTQALNDVRAALAQRIRAGLAREGEEIRALPAFLAPPIARLQGRALTIDTGGTNMRAAVVELGADGSERVAMGPVHAPVPTGRDGARVTALDFWRAHVELVEQITEQHGADAVRGLPVGFCFSYPSASQQNHDARLLRWTKGVEVDGVEDTLVGAALTDALRARGLEPGPVVVLNDTVAALMAGVRDAHDPAHTIGLIVGTGTNIAAFFDKDAMPKLAHAAWRGPMAVNLESGNFAPPHLSPCDDVVDQASDNPGAQRFEKAVSGHYLPLVARALSKTPAPADGAALVALASAGDATCRAVLERSADLVAAALAGVADVSAPGHTLTVLAEGGLFWSPSGYAERVSRTLASLGLSMRIVKKPDANLIGSAAAALSAR
jgi:hexokinase